MTFDDNDRPVKRQAAGIEAIPLDPLSIADLEWRITALTAEIDRCRAAISRKQADRALAGSLFTLKVVD